MLLSHILDSFSKASPVTVITRSLMERVLDPRNLDELFNRTAKVQYQDTLLFSSVVDVMGFVVTRKCESIHSTFMNYPERFPVTLKCFYEKVRGVELSVMRELVRDTATRLTDVLRATGGTLPEPLLGFRTKILDGNCLAGTQHRIRELRDLGSSPLPGKSLVVFDLQLGLVTDLFPWEDGHAQERALLEPVLASVQQDELWLADRNFCTLGWIAGVVKERHAHVLVREHANLPWTATSEPQFVGRVETGEVREQDVTVTLPDGTERQLRRIIVKLDQPTRDGDTEVFLLTDLTAEQAKATVLAEVYLLRWRIENVFNVLTTTFDCEQERLGYPKAALFAFSVTVVIYNIISVLKAVLREVHGAERVEEQVSIYHMAEEVRRTHPGMMIAVQPTEWEWLRTISLEEFAQYIRGLAENVELRRYKKARTRKKRRSSNTRQYDPQHPHVSTAKVLAERCNR